MARMPTMTADLTPLDAQEVLVGTDERTSDPQALRSRTIVRQADLDGPCCNCAAANRTSLANNEVSASPRTGDGTLWLRCRVPPADEDPAGQRSILVNRGSG